MHALSDISIILPILGLVVHPQIYVRAVDFSLGCVGDPRIEDAKTDVYQEFSSSEYGCARRAAIAAAASGVPSVGTPR